MPASIYPEATLVVQERRGSWGTGHAVRTVIESLGVMHGTVLVLFSDTPMLRVETLANLAAEHEAHGRGGDRADRPGAGPDGLRPDPAG